MIWAQLDLLSFERLFGSFHLTLKGAIASSVSQLGRGSAVAAARQGIAAARWHYLPLLASEAARVVQDARVLGAAHAGAAAPSASDGIAEQIQAIAMADSRQAVVIAEKQALRYAIARRTSPHPAALLHAMGELGTGPFAQLDRAGREFRSEALAVGHVRLAAAHGYMQSFVQAAKASGHSTAVLKHPEGDTAVELEEVALAPLFHPNTRAALQLPETA